MEAARFGTPASVSDAARRVCLASAATDELRSFRVCSAWTGDAILPADFDVGDFGELEPT
jgi:hypothetical protein